MRIKCNLDMNLILQTGSVSMSSSSQSYSAYALSKKVNPNSSVSFRPCSTAQSILCTGHSGLRENHSTIQALWNLQRHSSLANSSFTLYSTKQIEHSCAAPSSPRQSFSDAIKGSIWTGCAMNRLTVGDLTDVDTEADGTDDDDGSRAAMHCITWASLAVSSPSTPRGGNSFLHTGHMSLSCSCGALGRADVAPRLCRC